VEQGSAGAGGRGWVRSVCAGAVPAPGLAPWSVHGPRGILQCVSPCLVCSFCCRELWLASSENERTTSASQPTACCLLAREVVWFMLILALLPRLRYLRAVCHGADLPACLGHADDTGNPRFDPPQGGGGKVFCELVLSSNYGANWTRLAPGKAYIPHGTANTLLPRRYCRHRRCRCRCRRRRRRCC
jgi:hypothetical protein